MEFQLNGCKWISLCAKTSNKLGFRVNERGSVGLTLGLTVRYHGTNRPIHELVTPFAIIHLPKMIKVS